MKKSRRCGEIVCLNRAAFRIPSPGAEAGLAGAVEAILARALGSGNETLSGCTEFTCNLFAPAPPPQS